MYLILVVNAVPNIKGCLDFDLGLHDKLGRVLTGYAKEDRIDV